MKRKIIISLPHLKHGGSERAASELANYFVSQNIETVLLLMFNKPKSYELDERVKVIEPTSKWNFIPKFIYPFFLLIFLRFHIKKESPDSLLSLGYKSFIFFACLNLDVRLIDSLRTSPNRIRFPNNKFYNLIYSFIRGILNKRIDGVIAQTKWAKQELLKTHRCKVISIPNPIREIEKYDVDRKNIILSVGRLSEEKGHKYLIEAFSRLENHHSWNLQLLGDGPQFSNLKKLSYELGIEDSVIFEGFKYNVDYYMNQAKIFVLPSLIEGFPNSLIEAMANGLACISFNCESGPSEIINDGENGFLVEVKNVSQLTQHLETLIEHDNLRKKIGLEATKVVSCYEKSKIGKQYISFLFNESSKPVIEPQNAFVN